MSDIDYLVKKFAGMKAEDYAQVVEVATAETSHLRWVPNPGPQTEAYFCQADELLYGGEPGGGKSALLIGLAFNCHGRSLIMRRQYTDLGGLTDFAIKINGSRSGYNGSAPPKLRMSDARFIDFAAASTVGDEQHWMGQAHDLIGFDEAYQFAESQIRFLMGWLRTEDQRQRCRVVLATNPPLSAEGLWVTKMFAPWIDPRFPKPARHGELRWYVSGDDDEDVWVDGPQPVQVGGRMVRPKSRTYIHSSVSDNPYYAGGDYERQLHAMQASTRNILLGGFRTSFEDQPNQLIPTEWILLAQERWTPHPPSDIPMCALGVDCSGGGKDPMVIAPRFDAYFAKMTEVKGSDIPRDRAGSFCAGRVLTIRKDGALPIIDMGGGFGGSMYEHFRSNHIEAYAYKGAEATTKRTVDRKLGFTNKRSAALWGFRELLDPDQPNGSPAALPPDSQLVADLSAPTFKITARGVEAETKESVCERLGRSTNHGDAAIMAWWEGARHITHADEWIDRGVARSMRGQRPRVIMGGRQPLTAQRRNNQ